MANDLIETNKDSGRRPTLSVDWKLYEEYLQDSDLSDDQKRELIETIWYIVMTFVDLGFGLDPVQQVHSSGKDRKRVPAITDGTAGKDSLSPKESFAAVSRTTRKGDAGERSSDEI